MSNTSITNVEITDTFQIWISKTNELVDLVNENVMLAGPGQQFTIQGNSKLTGSFEANELIAQSGEINDLSITNLEHSFNANDPIISSSPIIINTNSENIFTLQTTASNRPIFRLVNGGNATWEVGHSTTASTSPFTIRTPGANPPQFTVGQDGVLSIDSIQVKNISIVGGGGGLQGVAESAERLETERTIAASGDISWSVSFDGSENVSGVATVQNSSITNEKIRQSGGLSVIGRSPSSTGNVADITAGTDHQVLRRSGASVAFGPIALNQSSAVTGVLPPANGGTGISSFTAGRILFGAGSTINTDAALFWDNSNKRLGISTSSPRERLEVNGNVRASLFIGRATSANYADLAEKFVPDKKYPAGTVVYIGGNKEITSSVVGCKAIGVISEFPAVMMNSDQKDGVYVALKGRVPVFVVDNVKKGDILVPGDNGKAVKGNISDTNILGIALADAKNKKTEILVL